MASSFRIPNSSLIMITCTLHLTTKSLAFVTVLPSYCTYIHCPTLFSRLPPSQQYTRPPLENQLWNFSNLSAILKFLFPPAAQMNQSIVSVVLRRSSAKDARTLLSLPPRHQSRRARVDCASGTFCFSLGPLSARPRARPFSHFRGRALKRADAPPALSLSYQRERLLFDFARERRRWILPACWWYSLGIEKRRGDEHSSRVKACV